MDGDFVQFLPTRYWDRYWNPKNFTNSPNQSPGTMSDMAYFAGSHSSRSATWRSIEWEGTEHLYSKLVVRVRFDGAPEWSERATNRAGGIWEFPGTGGTRFFRSASGGPIIADTIEVMVHFAYDRGAYGPDETGWKETPRLDSLTVTYGNPLVVRKVELLDY